MDYGTLSTYLEDMFYKAYHVVETIDELEEIIERATSDILNDNLNPLIEE